MQGSHLIKLVLACGAMLSLPQAVTAQSVSESTIDGSPSTQQLTSIDRPKLLKRLGFTPAEKTAVLLVVHKGVHCVHCLSQLSLLAEREEAFKKAGISLIGVSAVLPEEDKLNRFREALDIQFPLKCDETSELIRKLGCQGADGQQQHGLFLIDQEGEIRWRMVSEHAFENSQRIFDVCCERLKTSRHQ